MAQDRDTVRVHELLAEFCHPFTSASQTSVPATTVSFSWEAHPQSSWCLPQSLVTRHLDRFYISFRLLAWTFSSLQLLPFNSGGGWAYGFSPVATPYYTLWCLSLACGREAHLIFATEFGLIIFMDIIKHVVGHKSNCTKCVKEMTSWQSFWQCSHLEQLDRRTRQKKIWNSASSIEGALLR